MTVLQTQERIPLYTNMIKRLTDRFINRNPRIHLSHIHRRQPPPPHDPYHLPHLYANGHYTSDSSFEEFFEPNEDFNNPFNPHKPYYSDDNSQHHTNPPPDFSNDSIRQLSPSQLHERFRDRFPASPTPGRHLGMDVNPMAIIPPLPDLDTQTTHTLDLNQMSAPLNPAAHGPLSTDLELSTLRPIIGMTSEPYLPTSEMHNKMEGVQNSHHQVTFPSNSAWDFTWHYLPQLQGSSTTGPPGS